MSNWLVIATTVVIGFLLRMFVFQFSVDAARDVFSRLPAGHYRVRVGPRSNGHGGVERLE
jgi:hypothetical protein